ncbi:Importin subunit beta-1 [Camelus dromedarius]|uniref:Importin subunit beta-1 n=1 Tax=Camelus dromedarius TaxID=9838 RepID=A0A5N4C250_CAMDR|nr:Importin subunit beta-1 [Camelus dromedarius]
MMADVVCAEIPVNQWSGFCLQLVTNVTNSNTMEHMKEGTADETKSRVNLAFFDHIARLENHLKNIRTGAAEPIRNFFTAFGKNVLKLVASRLMILEVLTEEQKFKTSKI